MDVAAALISARTAVADVLATAGTRLDITRPAGDVSGDTGGAPSVAAVAAGVAALLLPAGSDALALGLAGSAAPEPGTVAVLLGPDVDVVVGDVLTVVACLDPRAVGAAFLVRALEVSSAGVVRRGTAVQVSGAGTLAGISSSAVA